MTPELTIMSGAIDGLGFHLEKIAGRGEDARPLWAETGTAGTVAVFDGLGGAGSSLVEGSGATQAAIAARLARDVVRLVRGDAPDLEPRAEDLASQ